MFVRPFLKRTLSTLTTFQPIAWKIAFIIDASFLSITMVNFPFNCRKYTAMNRVALLKNRHS